MTDNITGFDGIKFGDAATVTLGGNAEMAITGSSQGDTLTLNGTAYGAIAMGEGNDILNVNGDATTGAISGVETINVASGKVLTANVTVAMTGLTGTLTGNVTGTSATDDKLTLGNGTTAANLVGSVSGVETVVLTAGTSASGVTYSGYVSGDAVTVDLKLGSESLTERNIGKIEQFAYMSLKINDTAVTWGASGSFKYEGKDYVYNKNTGVITAIM